MRYLLLFVLLSMQLAACNATKSIRLHNLSIGMTEREAAEAIRKKPENSVCAKQYPEGSVEVVQYSEYEYDYSFDKVLIEQYWLYFFNDKLVAWHRSGDDCEAEADRIYGMSVSNRNN